MKKSLILLLMINFITQCGTEVGNHFKDPEKETQASTMPTGKADVPEVDSQNDNFIANNLEQAFFLNCGSVFTQTIKSPIQLSSSSGKFWSGTFTDGVWNVNYNDTQTYIISKNGDSIQVELQNNEEFENEFSCEEEQDLIGTGNSNEKTRFVTVSRDEVTYKALWVVDETTSPQTLIKMQLQRVSDNETLIEWE